MKTSQPLEKHVIYLDELLQQMAEELGSGVDANKTLRLVTVVLIAIRNRLPFESSIYFFHLLPLAFQAIYLNNWAVGERMPERLESMEDLIDEIIDCDWDLYLALNNSRQNVNKVVKAVFKVISSHLSKSDLETDLGFLPADIERYLEQYNTTPWIQTVDSSIWFS